MTNYQIRIHKLLNSLLITYLLKINSDKCLNNYNKVTDEICLQKQLNSKEITYNKLPNNNSQTGKCLTDNLHLEKVKVRNISLIIK